MAVKRSEVSLLSGKLQYSLAIKSSRACLSLWAGHAQNMTQICSTAIIVRFCTRSALCDSVGVFHEPDLEASGP